jgi:hypothetical protein
MNELHAVGRVSFTDDSSALPRAPECHVFAKLSMHVWFHGAENTDSRRQALQRFDLLWRSRIGWLHQSTLNEEFLSVRPIEVHTCVVACFLSETVRKRALARLIDIKMLLAAVLGTARVHYLGEKRQQVTWAGPLKRWSVHATVQAPAPRKAHEADAFDR